MIDKSRKKDYYFDTDYSPFLIEDPELGIVRVPDSRSLKEAVPCEDTEFLDFIAKCLEVDPERRFSASVAIEHPWIKAALKSLPTRAKTAPRPSDLGFSSKRLSHNESTEIIERLLQP